MAAMNYSGGEKEWLEVHQPFELAYHKRRNFRWPGQEAVWDEQWDNVFGFAGISKDGFNSSQAMLDVGCGSKPALDWFREGEKWFVDPLLDEFRHIPQVAIHWAKHDPSRLIAKTGEDFIPDFEGRFDFILCWNAIDHAYNAEAVLRNIHAYAKPEALILLGTDMGEKPHLGHPGIGTRAGFMSTLRELFHIEREASSGFKYCRQKAFILRKRTDLDKTISELEKYEGIYSSPDAYRGYGHSNHGRNAIPMMMGVTSVLDVGCGHNEFVKQLRQRQPDVRAIGVDFACPSADVCAKATSLPFAEKQWDMITSFDMLEHLMPSEVSTALLEFARVSRRFCFSICHRPSVITWKGLNLHPTVQPESWWISEIQKAGGVNIRKSGQYILGEWLDATAIHRGAKPLTIAMLTHDDFDGVYFTIQSLRLHHHECMGEVEFLVLNNNPNSKQGKAVAEFCKWITPEPVRHVAITDARGTALRDRAFQVAESERVLCLDCHVLLAPGSLRRLLDYDGWDTGDLLQGPLLYDNMQIGATHMEPVWRDGMHGTWAVDPRGAGDEPFEIPAHGLGLFACRKDAWQGFNPKFRGFGGEECYIHEKFRRAGRRTICLPWLRWLHRFARPNGIPYPIKWEDRVFNYLVGHHELGLDPSPVIEHFKTILPPNLVMEIEQSAIGMDSSTKSDIINHHLPP